MNAITSLCPVSDAKLDQIREETKKDISLKTDLEYTVTGWPTYKQDVKLAARDFFAIRGELSVCNGLLVKGDRIVIPYSMRKEILERIHDGHMGITKCRERTNQSVWWPHVSKDIQDRVANCGHCLEKRPSQAREPVLPSSLPDRPFQKVGVDLYEFRGLHYLVIVDYYSRYVNLALAKHHVFDGGEQDEEQFRIPWYSRNSDIRQWNAVHFSRIQDFFCGLEFPACD